MAAKSRAVWAAGGGLQGKRSRRRHGGLLVASACSSCRHNEEFENYPIPPTSPAAPASQQDLRATGRSAASPSWTARALRSRIHRLRPRRRAPIRGPRRGYLLVHGIRQLKTYVFPRWGPKKNRHHWRVTPGHDFFRSGRLPLHPLRGLCDHYNSCPRPSMSPPGLLQPRGVPGMFGIMIASYLAETPTQWRALRTDGRGARTAPCFIDC